MARLLEIPTSSEFDLQRTFKWIRFLLFTLLALLAVSCGNIGITPEPNGQKAIPSTPIISDSEPSFFSRDAGDGSIIETNYSSLPSHFLIENQWSAQVDGIKYLAFAGAQRNEPGGGQPLDKPFPGVLVLRAIAPNGDYLPEQSGQFFTPVNAGPLRIVDAQGMNLILLAEDGTIFEFDVSSRQFLPTEIEAPFTRIAGAGTIIEANTSKKFTEDYRFVNYWKLGDDNFDVVVMAGASNIPPLQGVLAFFNGSPDDENSIFEGYIYNTPLEGGALRVVDAENYILTVVSETGLIYIFDIKENKFLSLPAGIDDLGGIYIKSEPLGIIPKTPTPTRALTPRPSSTALPTYNPYP